MGRVLAVLLLSASLTAFAQTTQGPNITIPARVNLDPAPPVINSATAPYNVMTNPVSPNESPVSVQEYRVATPMVPSGPPPSVVTPNIPAPETGAAAGTTATAAAPATATGSIGAGLPEPTPSITVAEASAQYKMNKAGMRSRVVDNNSLAALDKNPSGLVSANADTMPQSDTGDAEPQPNAKPEYAAAGDVLDPRDLAAVEAALRKSSNQVEPSADTAARYETMTSEAEAAVENADALPQSDVSDESVAAPAATQSDAVQQQSGPAEAAAPQGERLPDSSTGLPLLALLGLVGVAGGIASVIRYRG